MTPKQRTTLRSAAYWLRDYRKFLLPVIRDASMDAATVAIMKRQCEKLEKLAVEVGRIERSAGQAEMPLA